MALGKLGFLAVFSSWECSVHLGGSRVVESSHTGRNFSGLFHQRCEEVTYQDSSLYQNESSASRRL